MAEPTTEAKFDFPCPHCEKVTPVTMTICGGVPKSMVTTIVRSEGCTFDIGVDSGSPEGDFTGIAVVPARSQIFATGLEPEHLLVDDGLWVGTIPAGVEIDEGGEWINRIAPRVSPEVRSAILASIGSSGFAATHTTYDPDTGKVVTNMVDPKENHGRIPSPSEVATFDAYMGALTALSADTTNAKRECPTCGTPAFCHPDRIRGEDALPIPPEMLARGTRMLANMMPDKGFAIAELTAEAVFREMLDPKPGVLTTDHISFMSNYAKAYAATPHNFRTIVEQVAAMDGRAVSALELTMVVIQAKQALSVTAKSG